MRASLRIVVVEALAAIVAVGCGGGGSNGGGTVTTTGTPTPTGFVIRIAALRYSPVNLSVPPGATITVVNEDVTLHSVTSEATTGAYTPGGVNGVTFDTGAFSTGQRTIQIPTTAAAGTVIPFYCTAHLTMMLPPNGTITVDPAAQPPSTPQPPASGPTGY
jgi:plastocyanin